MIIPALSPPVDLIILVDIRVHIPVVILCNFPGERLRIRTGAYKRGNGCFQTAGQPFREQRSVLIQTVINSGQGCYSRTDRFLGVCEFTACESVCVGLFD